MHKFKRRYLLRISTNPVKYYEYPKEKITQSSSAGLLQKFTQGDVCTLPEHTEYEGIGFYNHQFTASIEYSKEGKKNSGVANITLYNVNRETQQKIKPDSFLVLQAGYEDDVELPVIYIGQIVQVMPARVGVDRTLRLICGSGTTIQRNLRMSYTFPKGHNYKQIIDRIVEEIQKYGIPLGEFITDPQTPLKKKAQDAPDNPLYIVPPSFSINGNLFNNLGKVLSSIGFHYYIMHGKLYIEPSVYGTNLNIYQLDDDSIINNIEPQEEIVDSLSGSGKNKIGLKVTTLLTHDFHLNSFVRLTNKDYAGLYNPTSISYQLDFLGNEWFTTLNLVEANA